MLLKSKTRLSIDLRFSDAESRVKTASTELHCRFFDEVQPVVVKGQNQGLSRIDEAFVADEECDATEVS